MANKGYDEEYDAVVIGAGMGGLACACCLALQGRKVKVFEQHYVPGGCCSSFSRTGFKFDAGVLHLTGGSESGAFHRVLSALDMEDQLEFTEINQRFVFPGLTLESTRDMHKLVTTLVDLFPREEKGINALFRVIKEMYQDLKGLPKLSPLLAGYRHKSFQDLMDEYIQSPELKAVVSANWHLWNPMWSNSAIDYAALLVTEQTRGYYYPLGGIQAIPDAFVKVLKKHGGEIEYRTPISRVLTQDGRSVGIETAKGKRVRSRYVVSNVSARQTFLDLVGVQNLSREFLLELESLDVSLSAFYVYLGVDLDLKRSGIAPETVVYETFDNSGSWDGLLHGELSVPCFGIAVPTLTSPGLAPPGKHIVVVMTMARYHLVGKSWKEEKARFARTLVEKAEKLIPGLSQHIVVQEAASPLTYERYTLNTMGAAMGWSFSPGMFLRRLAQETPVQNLYLAGHWTMPGGGVPAVALSGLKAAQMILAADR